MPNRGPAIVLLFLPQTFSPSLTAYDFTPQFSAWLCVPFLALVIMVDPKRPQKSWRRKQERSSRAVLRFGFQIGPGGAKPQRPRNTPTAVASDLFAASPGGLKREMCYRVRGELIASRIGLPPGFLSRCPSIVTRRHCANRK